MNKKRKPLELYVHIPFCIRKCAYCDFVSGPGTKAMQKEYEEALLAEIDAAEETAESEVISVFFGGGTPSAVDAGMLARVMEKPAEQVRFFQRMLRLRWRPIRERWMWKTEMLQEERLQPDQYRLSVGSR